MGFVCPLFMAAASVFSVSPSLSQSFDPASATAPEEAIVVSALIVACRMTKDELEVTEGEMARFASLCKDTEVASELKIAEDAEQEVGKFHTKFFADQ